MKYKTIHHSLSTETLYLQWQMDHDPELLESWLSYDGYLCSLNGLWSRQPALGNCLLFPDPPVSSTTAAWERLKEEKVLLPSCWQNVRQ